jgi:hypothetical protein
MDVLFHNFLLFIETNLRKCILIQIATPSKIAALVSSQSLVHIRVFYICQKLLIQPMTNWLIMVLQPSQTTSSNYRNYEFVRTIEWKAATIITLLWICDRLRKSMNICCIFELITKLFTHTHCQLPKTFMKHTKFMSITYSSRLKLTFTTVKHAALQTKKKADIVYNIHSLQWRS